MGEKQSISTPSNCSRSLVYHIELQNKEDGDEEEDDDDDRVENQTRQTKINK